MSKSEGLQSRVMNLDYILTERKLDIMVCNSAQCSFCIYLHVRARTHTHLYCACCRTD